MPETADAPAAPAAPATPSAPASPESVQPSGESPPPSDSLVAGQPPPEAPAAPATLVNPDGTFISDWATKLPDEFADARTSLTKFKSVPELVKAYQHANSLVGKKGIIPPTADSSPEQVAEYRKAMGVPENPKDYAELVKPKLQMPEGIQWSDEIAGQYFELAHRNNIPPAVMQQLAQLNLKQREFENRTVQSQIAERKQDGIALLRQQWGANYDRNIGLARKAAAHYGVSEDDPGFASPNMVKAWVRAMNDMGEGKFVSAGSSLPSGSADFAAKAKDIQTNKENPLYKRYWDGDRDVQEMVREYHRKATSR